MATMNLQEQLDAALAQSAKFQMIAEEAVAAANVAHLIREKAEAMAAVPVVPAQVKGTPERVIGMAVKLPRPITGTRKAFSRCGRTLEAVHSSRCQHQLRLKEALQAAGVPINGLEFRYVDETVAYPGGSYQNRLIAVTLANGKTENFGADLVARNPWVAVVEILNLMEEGGTL